MKKASIAVAVLALAGGAAWIFWPSRNGASDKKIETRRARVERGDLVIHVTATGEIKPVKEVELKSKASGQVVRFQKEPGDPVEAGELIAELDKRNEQRTLDLASSNLNTAEGKLELTRLQYAADLSTAESEAAGAHADELEKAAELRRLDKLSGELITQTELGAVRLAARLAEERSKQAAAALTFSKSRKEADEKLSLAEVQKARVSVEDAKERLRDTEIRAPMKGILLKKLVEEGQIVASGISATTGGTTIAVVADVSRLIVEANVDETDIAKVRKGQRVEISLVTGSSERFTGTVDLLLPKGEIDSNVIVFKVRVAVKGDIFGRVYAGMTAAVRILVDERRNALLVPSGAVRKEKGGDVITVAEGEGTKTVPVTTGLDNGEKTEIVSGAEENAEVVISYTTVPDAVPGGRRRGRGLGF